MAIESQGLAFHGELLMKLLEIMMFHRSKQTVSKRRRSRIDGLVAVVRHMVVVLLAEINLAGHLGQRLERSPVALR